MNECRLFFSTPPLDTCTPISADLLRSRVGRRIILDDYNILKGKEVTIAEFPKTRRMVERLETDHDIFPTA